MEKTENEEPEFRSFRKAFFSPEWLWRYLMALLIGCQLWVQTHYITREEYALDKKELHTGLAALNSTMTGLNTSLELLNQRASQLADHEARIRILERLLKP